ncbi:hypothetical protein EJ04DRAFT_529760, partial [Polyplosphaeria fusca]
MDPLSITASIIAVLQLSAKVLEYLNNVKDAPKDRTQCAIEMLNLCGLLYKLRDHVEQGDPTQPWYLAIHDLAVKNGPLDQFKQALETLQTKMGAGNKFNKAGEALLWKFKKEEISSILDQIEHEFKDSGRLEVQASDDDVRRFVAGQVHRLPNCIQRNHELQMLVQDKIAKSVDGMFLLARLYTDSLLDKRTPKEIRATLARLSKGSVALNDAYKDAIQRIEGQLAGDSKRAKNVLSWITYAQRPLTTAELCCALAVEHEEEELDLENIPDVEDLVLVCAGLVVVDEESGVIRLVHFTTQEYLERIRKTWNPGAQLDIASTCLTYLSFDDFKNGSCSTDAELEGRLQQNVFLDYAARYWGLHALPVEDDVYALACSFLLHKGSVSCATQAMSMRTYKYNGYSEAFPHNRIFIHITAQFGLAGLLKRIIESTEEEETTITVKSKDSYGQDGLYIAAENGHDETVKLLLGKGADVNAQGGQYGNALQAASSGGHEA